MVRASFCCLGILVLTDFAHAEPLPCIVISQGVQVKLADGTAKTGRVKLDDCRGLEATNEPVEICYATKSRTADCRKLSNATFDKFASAAGSLLPPSVQRVFAVMTGEQRTTMGVRKANEAVRKRGFPYNEVLPRTDHLLIASDEVQQVDSFVLTTEGKGSTPVFQVQRTALPLRVPGTLLVPGQSYSWRARSAGEEFTGGFKVASNDIVQKVAGRIKEIEARDDISQEARLFLQAQTYEAYGLPYERDLVLTEMSR